MAENLSHGGGVWREGYNGYMRRVNVSTLKNNLSKILASLEKEGPVLVMDRTKPVGELRVPPPPSRESEFEAKLEEMERKGLVRRAKQPLDPATMLMPAAKTNRPVDLEALIRWERDSR